MLLPITTAFFTKISLFDLCYLHILGWETLAGNHSSIYYQKKKDVMRPTLLSACHPKASMFLISVNKMYRLRLDMLTSERPALAV